MIDAPKDPGATSEQGGRQHTARRSLRAYVSHKTTNVSWGTHSLISFTPRPLLISPYESCQHENWGSSFSTVLEGDKHAAQQIKVRVWKGPRGLICAMLYMVKSVVLLLASSSN